MKTQVPIQVLLARIMPLSRGLVAIGDDHMERARDLCEQILALPGPPQGMDMKTFDRTQDAARELKFMLS